MMYYLLQNLFADIYLLLLLYIAAATAKFNAVTTTVAVTWLLLQVETIFAIKTVISAIENKLTTHYVKPDTHNKVKPTAIIISLL